MLKNISYPIATKTIQKTFKSLCHYGNINTTSTTTTTTAAIVATNSSSLLELTNTFNSKMSFSTQSRKRTNYNNNNNRNGGNGKTPVFRHNMNKYNNTNRSNNKQTRDPKLRTHAISVISGDYTDYDNDDIDDDDEYTFDETIYNRFDDENNNDDNEESKWNLQKFDSSKNNIDPDEEAWHRQRETEAYQKQLEEDTKRAKWIENAKPPIRTIQIDSSGRSYGKGGRKVSSARVWIYPGEGIVTVNRREFLDFFPRESDREMILSPFVATKTCGMFDMTVQVEGGGVT